MIEFLRRQYPFTILGIVAAFVAFALVTHWIAGDLSTEEEAAGAARPTPASTKVSTPKATATTTKPPPSGTLTATPLPTATDTLAVTPAPPPVPATYRLAPDVPSANLERMVDFALIPGTSDQAIVATQKQRKIWRVSLGDASPPTLYGDLSDRVGGGGEEEGLLSVALSPDFQTDGRIYIYYTRGSPQPTVLSRFQVVNGVMDMSSETVILQVPQFAANHNGGRVLFGPDGYLYLSLGDGGGGGDPQENGQNTGTLLGKLLRLKATGEATYSIPPDNPLTGDGSARCDVNGVPPSGSPSGAKCQEIWAYGLRNPWRYSFDRATGDLWAGDVGQNSWEEVDRVVKGGNYGWNCYEGFTSFKLTTACPDQAVLQFPRAVYPTHDGGSCAVVGGYVYRGAAMPQLYGWYVYGDYCSGRIWAVNTTDASDPILLLDANVSISSFAERPDAEILVLTFGSAIYRLVQN